jgi:hypothetical protein
LISGKGNSGGGFVDTGNVKSAIDYLRGVGSQPGAYTLANVGGYTNLGGMMTWSINWDAVSSCSGTYSYASNYQDIFGATTNLTQPLSNYTIQIYPNPTSGEFFVSLKNDDAEIIIANVFGQEIYKNSLSQRISSFHLPKNGIYLVYVRNKDGIRMQKLIVNK